MKKTSIILAAFVLALGLTQCKKEQAPTTATEENGIRITLDLGSNSRAQVDPNHPQTNGEVSWAPVSFETNDTIYVGYKGSFVGKLGFNSNKFNGTLDGNKIESLGVDGESHLHFYLLGGKGFTPTPTSTGFTVDISDQTDRYPVIAYAASNEAFSVENTIYTAKLKHKASIMKFDVTTRSAAPICITGMNNKVTVDFTNPTGTDNGFAYDQIDGGLIKMAGQTGSGEKTYWAIVLPQAALEASETDGSANSYDDPYYYSSKRPAIHKIESNKYYHENNDVIAMAVNSRVVDLSKLTHHYEAQDGDLLMGTLTSAYQISIASGATVVLRNANINSDESMTGNYAGITCPFDATIILQGTNYVRAFADNYPGIFIAPDNTLTIQGDGSLYAECINYGAGIGGGKSIACGNIVIKGGYINAKSYGVGNAAIGAGYNESGNGADCGYISIEGGTINATASNGGAGIGSGLNSNCGDITISGGTVTAKSQAWGAGIGEGYYGTCGTITIGAGITEVTATRGDGWFGSSSVPQCIGSYTGENTVTVSVASVLRDSGEGSTTRTIQH